MIPIALILSSFYATHVVNVITWSRAYAVFPIPTFVHHKGHMLEDLSGKHLSPLLRKWATRGWEFDQTLWPEEETSTHSIQARRRVADKYTWKISHDTTDLRLPGARAEDDHGIGHNVFEMDKKGSHYLVGIGFPNFESPVLMHTYVVPTASWFYFLDVRLRRAIYMQLLTKLDPSEWPESGPRSKIRVMRHKDCYHAQEYEIGYLLSKQKLGDWQLEKRTPFERPENWRYLDDEIPRWYEIWKEEEDWAHGNAAVCSGSGWERWEIRDREF